MPCVSVTVAEVGLTFILVASAETAAALDAVQYLDGGPCVDAALSRQDLGCRRRAR